MIDAVFSLFKILARSEDASVGRRDVVMLFVVMGLLAVSFYLELQAHLLTGSVMSIAAGATSSADDERWLVQLACDWLPFDCGASQDELRKALILSFVLCQIAKCGFYVTNVYFHHNSCDEKNHRMRIAAFNHVLGLDQAFFDTHSISEIRGAMNVHAINNLITWNVPYICTLTLKAIMITYFLLQLNLQLGAVAVGAMLAIKFGVLDPMNAFERRTHKVQRKLDTLNNQIVEEVFSMVSCVKMFAKEAKHAAEHDEAQRRYIANINRVVVYRCVREFGYGVLKVCVFGGVLWMAPRVFAEAARVTPGELTGFFLLLQEFQDIFGRIKHHSEILVREFADIDRFLTLMQQESSMPDGAVDPGDVEGRIEFRNVHFEYPTRPGERVLNGLNLSIAPRKTTAIVGGSGAGKSTLSKLLLRLYDPTDGQVLIDGHDLRSVNGKSLRDQMGIVMQSPELFHMSLGENIAYGAVDGADAEQIEAAAELANCGFIKKFRGGLDTTAGTRGGSLSGGEKQRLAIARAAIRNPKVLILDEATSALDAENEQECKLALQRLMEGRTTLVIAHRLSTVRDADEIICMADGAVAERGTHKELMALDGVYASLVRKQLIEEEAKAKSTVQAAGVPAISADCSSPRSRATKCG